MWCRNLSTSSPNCAGHRQSIATLFRPHRHTPHRCHRFRPLGSSRRARLRARRTGCSDRSLGLTLRNIPRRATAPPGRSRAGLDFLPLGRIRQRGRFAATVARVSWPDPTRKGCPAAKTRRAPATTGRRPSSPRTTSCGDRRRRRGRGATSRDVAAGSSRRRNGRFDRVAAPTRLAFDATAAARRHSSPIWHGFAPIEARQPEVERKHEKGAPIRPAHRRRRQ